MEKEKKEILKQLVKKELKVIGEEEESVIFPGLKFLESIDKYERMLKEILDDLNK